MNKKRIRIRVNPRVPRNPRSYLLQNLEHGTR